MCRNRSFRELFKFNGLTTRNTPLKEFRKVEKILINRYFLLTRLEGAQMNQIHPLFVCMDRTKETEIRK